MKRYNKSILFIFIVLISITISGCNPTTYQNSIFNDDNEIIKDSDSYTYTTKIGKIEENNINYEFGSFSGMDTICKIVTSKESKVVFDFESEIDKGDFKVVIITPDDEIINVLNGTDSGSETISLREGTNRMKFVGKKAKGKVEIDIDSENEIEIQDGGFWD